MWFNPFIATYSPTLEFLARLGREYHHSFKVVNNQLVFTAKDKLGQTQPVTTLDLSQVLSIRLRDRIKDTTKQVNVSGYDSQGKKLIKHSKKSQAKRKTVKQSAISSGDELNLTLLGENKAQVQARADAALSEQSEDQQAGEIRLLGNPKLVAGNTLLLQNLGVFSGEVFN